MSRQTTDILYIDLDYYTPENYYVYTAEAAVALDGYVRDDYFAQGYFETDAVESSLTCELTEVVGEVKEFSATLTVTTTATVTATRTRLFDSTQESTVTLATESSVSRGFGSGLNAAADITCVNFRVRVADSNISGAFSATIICRATRTTESVLASQFTQSATAARTRTTQSSLTASFTAQAQAGVVQPAAATVNAQFAISVDYASVQLAQAQLDSAATLSSEGFVSNRRPRQVIESGTTSFQTGEFGSSLRVGNDGTAQNYIQYYPSTAWSQWRTMDFWVRPGSGFASNGNQCSIYEQNVSGGDSVRVLLQRLSTGYNIIIQQRINSTNYTYTGTPVAWSDFNHVRILRHSSGFDLWINGVLDTPQSDNTIEALPQVTQAPTLGRATTSTAQVDIDEFYLTTESLNSAGASTITVPTDQWRLSQAQQAATVVLHHFDGDFVDDLSITQQGASTLNASTALTATADVIKDSLIALNSAASVAVSVARTRSGASTLTASADVLAIGGELKDIILAITPFATVDVTGVKVKPLDASISAQFAFTAEGEILTLATANLNSAFAIDADIRRRIRPRGYAEWLTNNGIDINPYNIDPLEGSLYIPHAASQASQFVELFSEDDQEYHEQLWTSDAWTIELFHSGDFDTAWDVAQERVILGIPGKFAISLKGTRSGSVLDSTMRLWIVDDNGNVYNPSTSMNSQFVGSYSSDTTPPLNHIAVVKSGSNFRLFVNGYRKFSQNLAGTFTQISPTNDLLRLGYTEVSAGMDSYRALPGRYDGIKLSDIARYSTETYTIPSQKTIDNELVYLEYDKNTLGLFRFNEFSTDAPTLDEVSYGFNGIKESAASLTAQFNTVGTISGPQRLPATTVSSEFNSIIDADTILDAQATLDVASQISVPETEIIILFGSIMPVVAEITAAATRTQPASAAIASEFDLTAVAGPIREFDAQLDSNATVAADGVRARLADATLNIASTLSATADRLRTTGVDLESNATVTTTPTAVLSGASTQDSTASVDTDGTRVRFGDSDITGAFNAQLTVNAILRPLVFLESLFTQSAQPVKTVDVDSTANSEFAVAADSLKVVGFDAQLSGQFAITADNEIIRAVGSEMTVTTTVTANTEQSKTTGFASSLASEFDTTVDATRTRPGSADLTVEAGLAGAGINFVGFDALLDSEFNTTTIGGITVDAQALLTAFYSTLSLVDVINIDPFRTYTVEPETRGYIVLPENRLATVEQETRVNMIL